MPLYGLIRIHGLNMFIHTSQCPHSWQNITTHEIGINDINMCLCTSGDAFIFSGVYYVIRHNMGDQEESDISSKNKTSWNDMTNIK